MKIHRVVFCPECGSMIRKFEEEKGRVFGLCKNNHKTEIKPSINKKIVSRKKKSQEVIIVGDKELEIFEERANFSATCPYCESKRCKLVNSFTPWGDEEDVVIIKCLDCKKKFRQGYGG